MLSAFSSRRAAPDDPFLVFYAAADATRILRGEGVVSTEPIIRLPENRFAGNPLARAFGPFGEGPRSAGSDDRILGDIVPFADEFTTQLERLQYALDFDQKASPSPRRDPKAIAAIRERVQRLMSHARKDLDEGRLATAHSAAQQAESLAGESGIEFTEGEETPASLVQTLRTRIASDANTQNELPPEQSVESGADPAPPDFTPPVDETLPPPAKAGPAVDSSGGGPTLIPPETSSADLVDREPVLVAQAARADVLPTFEGASKAAPSETPVAPKPSSDKALQPSVEILPAPPDPDGPDETHLSEIPQPFAGGRRIAARDAALTDVVGPATSIHRKGDAPVFGGLPEDPALDDVPAVATSDTGGSFWPGGRASADDSAPSDRSDEAETPAPARMATGLAPTSNVQWNETPEAIRKPRTDAGFPMPFVAGAAALGGWLAWIVLGWGVRRMRSAARPGRG